MNPAASSAGPSLQQRLNEAVRLLAADPNDARIHAALYDLCLPEARAHGMKASTINRLIDAHPQVPGLRSVALMLCRELNDREDRLRHLEVLHKNGVNEELFYKEYAVMLKLGAHFERCLAICGEALETYPASADLRKLRAGMLLTLGQPEKALPDWSWITARAPEDLSARMSQGIVKLLISDCREGFEEYGVNTKIAVAEFALQGSLPEWRGEVLAGKHLLLWCTQGIGDIVMFASLLPWVLEQGAQVTLALFPKMIPLFARSFPEVRVVPFTNRIFMDYAECDFHSILDQLMRYGLPHYMPAQHPPYLKADAARVAMLRQKYLALSPAPKKLVGISWHTAHPDTFCQRNIPLEQWRPLFALPHMQYVSLQYGDHAAETEAFRDVLHTDASIDAYGDTDALAAQIRACDEVVSIQNSTVHLAGALGVKTTLMLSAASDWRWGLKRIDSRWYESVHIERQEKLLHWKPVLRRVRERLMAP